MSAADDTFREWCMYYTFVPVLLLRTLVAASAMSTWSPVPPNPRAVFSCRQRGRPSGQRSDNAVVDAPAEATHVSFSQWREQFRAEALAAGISATTFDRAFAGVQPDPAVIEADRSQPEFTRPVWQYLKRDFAPAGAQRTAPVERARRNLDRIEARYGVDRETLVAVWGLESSFGQIMGDKSVIRSLATLAHEGRRPPLPRAS